MCLARGADKSLQKAAANIFHSFHAGVERMEQVMRETFQELTKDSKANTNMGLRAGFKEEWLDPDSTVVL